MVIATGISFAFYFAYSNIQICNKLDEKEGIIGPISYVTNILTLFLQEYYAICNKRWLLKTSLVISLNLTLETSTNSLSTFAHM